MRRTAVLLLCVLPALHAQSVFEDFACAAATAVVDNGDGTATITCPEAHGFVAGTTQLLISGASGDWAGLNTFSGTATPFSISAAQTQFILSDVHRITRSATVANLANRFQWDSEIMIVTNYGTDNLLTVTRGADGTTAATHTIGVNGPTSGTITVNPNNSHGWTVGSSPTGTTFTVPFDCAGSAGHACAAFSGTLEIRRFTPQNNNSNIAMVSGYPGGESWGLTDWWHDGSISLAVPYCSDQTNLVNCVHGVMLPNNQKGYALARQAITSIVVDASHNATISLSAPWNPASPPYCCGGAAITSAGEMGTMGVGSFVFVTGMNETGLDPASINYMYDVAGCNGTIGTCTGTYSTIQVTMPNAPAGTYSPVTAAYFTQPARARQYGLLFVGGITPIYPAGTLHNYIKSGTWDPLTNRFCYYETPSLTGTPHAGFNTFLGAWETGTYPATGGTHGPYHWYHQLNMDSEAGQSIYMCMSNTPSIQVGLAGNDWGDDPTYHGWQIVSSYDNTPSSTGHHYEDGNTQIYLNGNWFFGSMVLYPLKFSTVASEPDEQVQNTALFYSAATGKYHVFVQGPKAVQSGVNNLFVKTNYEFRYSTASMKTNGYSTGICTSNGSTPGTSPCPAADQLANVGGIAYAGYKWFSGTVGAPTSTVYWAIKPFNTTIMGTSGSGQNPTWIITGESLNFSAGDHVTVTGVVGNTAANVSGQAISALQPRQYWFLHDPATGYVNPGTLTSITSDASGVCTANLTVAHNIVPGWVIGIYGAPAGSFLWTTLVEQKFTVTGTPTASTFTFNCPSTPPSSTFNADNSTSNRFSVSAMWGIGVAVAGTGTYASGGLITTNENNKHFTELAFTPPGTVLLQVAPSALSFNGVSGAANPASQNLALSAIGATLDNWSATKAAAWLSLSPTSGSAAGTSAASVDITGLSAGAYNDTINVASTTAGITNSPVGVPVTLTVTATAITTSSPLPGGTVGTLYSQTLAAAGGTAPYSWTVTVGSLCAGLSLSSGGVLSGTPTGAASCSFTVQASDANSVTASKPMALTVTAGPPLSIVTTSLPGGTVGAPYSQALQATGGTPAYSWSIISGALCTGLSLSSGGTISGTPASAGLCSFTVQATGGGTATQPLSITVTTSGMTVRGMGVRGQVVR